MKECGTDDDNLSKNLPPSKMLLYLPINPRFKRLFFNVNDEKNIIWHIDERKYDGTIGHVVDSLQWKKIDSFYKKKIHESIW